MPRRLNAVMLQRQRALARRRPNRWLTEECPPVDRETLQFAEWRA